MNIYFNSGFKKIDIKNRYNCFCKRKILDPDAYNYKTKSKSKNITIGQFILGKTLGKGTFGKVKLGTHSITGEKAAIKIIEKVKLFDETDKARISREIKILKSTFHHNIIRIYSVIETQKTIYLLTEYAEGGDLFNYIILKRKLSEYEACKYFHQLIDAVDYLHKLGICHRDLKPENMLLDHKKNLKIADFGLSNLYQKDELLNTACGSPGYASPEMIQGERYHGLLTDIWSCGVILFVMVCGYLPFDDNDENALYDKILEGKYHLPSGLSPNTKNLISRMLVTNPEKRINIDNIRKHPWYNMYNKERIDGLFISVQPIPIDYKVIYLMKQYGYNEEQVKHMLITNRHNNITTLYYMLIKKNIKKGIPSISDMISKPFLQYINKNICEPEYLILTKLNSSLVSENSAHTLGNINLINNAKITLGDGDKHEKTCSSIINNDFNSDEVITYGSGNSSGKKREGDIRVLPDTLENIIEMNENQCFEHEPKIKRFKGLNKLHLRNKHNEIPLTTQLRSQYDKYVNNFKVKKYTQFTKGFLQTSMSFHKSDNQQINHTFTLDNNYVSTTPSNNNSKSPTQINKHLNLYQKIYPKSKAGNRRFLSQPKNTKQNLSSNAGSSANSANKRNIDLKIIYSNRKKKQRPNQNYNSIHCKEFNMHNHSSHKNDSNIIFYSKQNESYKNQHRFHSMENKKPKRNPFTSLGYHDKRKKHHKHTIMCSQLYSLQKTTPRKNAYNYKNEHKKAISEPKKPKYNGRNNYRKQIQLTNLSTYKNRKSPIISLSLTFSKNNTNSNKCKVKAKRYSYITPMMKSRNPKQKNKDIESLNMANSHNMNNSIRNKKCFAFPGKQLGINMGYLGSMKRKLMIKNNYLHYTKGKNDIYRSQSTCSNSTREVPKFTGKCDPRWIFSKKICQLKEIILSFLPKYQINVKTNNSNHKFFCERESMKFSIEFFQAKDLKNYIIVNVSKIEGEDNVYNQIQQQINDLLKN